jgi:aryl-alcohol dehydrogenase-like predicted oxidoreductase
MDDLIRSGKVRYIGSSTYGAWQLVESFYIAKELGTHRFICEQPPYNLLDRRIEREVIPSCDHFSLGLLPYFPLASGFLTGKYKRGEKPAEDTRMAKMGQMAERTLTDANFAVLDSLEKFASERGRSVLELAISWLLANPRTSSVIAGATKPEQVTANIKAGQWKLTVDEMNQVDKLTRRK